MTNKENFKIKSTINKFKILIALFALSLLLILLTPKFLTVQNMLNVARQTSINAIIALGLSFVLLTGGIDLSVGSILGLSASISAGLVVWKDINPIFAIIIGVASGVVFGLIQGVVISRFNLPPFIVTLSGLTIFRGLTLVFQNGQPITGLGKMTEIGAGYLGPIPIPIIIMFAIFSITWFVQTQTRYSRYVYALGGNEEAARLSGVQTRVIKASVYAISGGLAAIAGIIVAARLNSAQPYAGSGYELDAIAAAVIGGVSLSGGKGSAIGVLIGAFIIGVLNNGLNLLNVSAYYQEIIKGIVILSAVILDMSTKKIKSTKK